MVDHSAKPLERAASGSAPAVVPPRRSLKIESTESRNPEPVPGWGSVPPPTQHRLPKTRWTMWRKIALGLAGFVLAVSGLRALDSTESYVDSPWFQDEIQRVLSCDSGLCWKAAPAPLKVPAPDAPDSRLEHYEPAAILPESQMDEVKTRIEIVTQKRKYHEKDLVVVRLGGSDGYGSYTWPLHPAAG